MRFSREPDGENGIHHRGLAAGDLYAELIHRETLPLELFSESFLPNPSSSIQFRHLGFFLLFLGIFLPYCLHGRLATDADGALFFLEKCALFLGKGR